jgi:hypothetical protein
MKGELKHKGGRDNGRVPGAQDGHRLFQMPLQIGPYGAGRDGLKRGVRGGKLLRITKGKVELLRE